MKILKLSLILQILFLWNFTFGQETKVEAPYFFIQNDSSLVLPLEASKADVIITGMIADVSLTQTYYNQNNKTIEAIYIFPGSSQSAVYELEMHIGDRLIKAELKEKEEARKEYEAAKAHGKSASLLEQLRPNVFQMNVANIPPGERVHVKLKYFEKILPVHGAYQFVLPSVVGPRYASPGNSAVNEIPSAAYLREGHRTGVNSDINLIINAGQPISAVKCLSHKVSTSVISEESISISLSPRERYHLNKDFIVEYSLVSDKVSNGLLLYEHEDENFFMASIYPPKAIAEEDLPPREYIFILDVSGSMFGFPLEVSKVLLRNLLKTLKPTDQFNVMLFAGTGYLYAEESMFAGTTNIEAILADFETRQGSGGTELLPALEKAIALPRRNPDVSRSLVIITDGYINVEKEAFELIRNNLASANVFAFGIGSSINRFLIEGLAEVGQGIPFFVEDESVASKMTDRFQEYISKPSLTNISVSFDGMEVYDVEPATIPDVFSNRPVTIIGKYTGNLPGTLTIKGYVNGSKYQSKISFSDFESSPQNKSIRLLWARERLRLLDDYRLLLYNQEHKAEMTKLSLKYHLLSAYTSFVAVDYMINENALGGYKRVNQALPLPAGVSDYAIGAEMEVKGSATKSKSNKSKYIKIGELAGTDNPQVISEIKLLFIKNLREIKACLSGFTFEDIHIYLTFDAIGNLVLIQYSHTDKEMASCLTELINTWNYKSNILKNTQMIIPISIQ